MIQNGWNPALLPPPPIAGTKRKSPPPSNASEQQQHTSVPPAAQQQQQSTRPIPPLGSSHIPPDPIKKDMAKKYDYSGSLDLEDTDPGLQSWPNPTGPRPTLTGGLGGATLSVCEYTLVRS